MAEKDLGITQVRGAKANISDLQVCGDGDTFGLLCKASSQSQGWMKSTKVANVHDGCIVQVTTQQRNPDGSYAVAEALTYVPGVHLDREADPRRFVPIYQSVPCESSPTYDTYALLESLKVANLSQDFDLREKIKAKLEGILSL